jgi:FkbM family methyltransferase
MKPLHRIFRFIWNQNWIGLRHKKAIYKKLCSYGDVPDAPFAADFFGLTYQGNLNNSVEFTLFYMGAFEKPLLFFLRDTMLNLRQSANGAAQSFFDIGANIGQHSLFMSLHADQVHSFEPYWVVSQKLERHVELNEISNIQLHKVGLSNQQEELDFYAPTGRNQGIGSFDAGTVSKGNKNLGKLALVRGDDYLAQNKLQDIALLKIDVEGFEKNVVVGLGDTLRKSRPVIVVEVTYGNSLSFASLDELRAALPTDYVLFRFNNRKADGSKARRRGAKAKRSGDYELIPFDEWRSTGQDDVIACPKEKLAQLPRKNSA